MTITVLLTRLIIIKFFHSKIEKDFEHVTIPISSPHPTKIEIKRPKRRAVKYEESRESRETERIVKPEENKWDIVCHLPGPWELQESITIVLPPFFSLTMGYRLLELIIHNLTNFLKDCKKTDWPLFWISQEDHNGADKIVSIICNVKMIESKFI
ncbi:hypothetical protein PAEPH01_1284 [Pancytospora epiphaga]|nr:hypothetical protein PAEPH01_1284 [Pancytospora epiphaga]